MEVSSVLETYRWGQHPVRILFLLATACVTLCAVPARGDAPNPNEARELEDTVEARVEEHLARYSVRLDALEEELVEVRQGQADQEAAVAETLAEVKEKLVALQGIVTAQERDLETTRLEVAASSRRSWWGGALLLLGLFFEVLGATFLAGPHLVARQEDVFTLASRAPAMDLALHDIYQTPRGHFLGLLGAVMLLIGFGIQCVATTLVLALGPAHALATVVVLVVPGFLLAVLISSNPEQSRRDKVRIATRNAKRLLSAALGRTGVCDFCSGRVGQQCVVWWTQEQNSEEHPYLYPPHDFRMGHERCLEESGLYVVSDSWMDSGVQVTRCSPQEFLEKEAPKIEAWFRERREAKPDRTGPFSPEEEFKALQDRLG